MIRPVGNRILVREIERDNQLESGLILAPSVQSVEKFGTVLDCGDGKLLPSGEVLGFAFAIGDTVMFTERGAFEFTYNGEKLYLLEGDYVMAVIE